MHNPYEGHSPGSVRRLVSRLADLGIDAAWSPPALADDDNADGGDADGEADDDGKQMRLL